MLPRRAGPRHDDVPVERLDRLAHAVPPKSVADDPLDEERGDACLNIREGADAADDERDREPARPGHLRHVVQLREADRREGDDGHVHRVVKRPLAVPEDDVPRRADAHERENGDERVEEAADRRVHDGGVRPDRTDARATCHHTGGNVRGPSSISPTALTLPAEGSLTSGDDLARGAPELARGTSIGRYLVLEKIGAGGMGVVYAAYDPQLDRRVALKALYEAGTPERDAIGRARLVREAKAMARLSHPNVVAVYDVLVEGEQVLVAMELVEGTSLPRVA